MKEEWKVYIKGVPERGEEVIKTLTDLGAENKDKHCDKYISCYFIYFINHKGYISAASINSEPAKIIMDNYTELHLPEKWRDGDVLVDRHDSQIMVLYEFISDKEADLFNAHIRLNGDVIVLHSLEVRNRFRLATDQEIEKFYEILHEHHKDWDAEKKQLVNWRWKPKINETYWFITGSNTIIRSIWTGTPLDNKYFEIGNCFQSREEAEAAAVRVKKALKGE